MMTFRRLRLAVSITVAAVAGTGGALPFAPTSGIGMQAARADATLAPNSQPVSPDQIVVRLAPGTTDAAAQQIAAQAGCTLERSLKYVPGFYVFKMNGSTGTPGGDNVGNAGKAAAAKPALAAPAKGRGARRSASQTSFTTPSAELIAAIARVKAVPGVLSADPNYISQATRSRNVSLPLGSFLSPVAVTAAPAAVKTTVGRAVDPGTNRFTAPTYSGTPLTPSDTYYNLQPDMDVIRMPEAWAIQKGVKSVIVGVADTGIYAAHPDFVRTDSGSQIVAAQNFVVREGDSTFFDDQEGHGTHVSGTIAAVTNNGVGVAGVAGLAANGVDIKLLEARVLGEGGGTDSDIADGLGWLVANGANVINMSLGRIGTVSDGYPLSSPLMKTAVDNALNAGVLVVASTGNDALDNSVIPHVPVDFPGIIAVTSVDNQKKLASYADFGGNVTIAAPGGDDPNFTGQGLIVSTWPLNNMSAASEGYPAPFPSGNALYQAIEGTSMAAPHVTGAVAVLLAAGLPANRVASVLTRTAQLPADRYDSHVYGAGILDLYSALAISEPNVLIKADLPTGTVTTYDPNVTVPFQLLVTDPTFDKTQITLEVWPVVNGPAPTLPQYTYTGANLAVTVQTPGPDAQFQNLVLPAPSDAPLELTGVGNSANDTPLKYKLVLKYKGVEVAQPYIVQVIKKRQPQGLSMFALPFQARQENSTNPETSAFGTTSFQLISYDPVNSGYVYFSPSTLPPGAVSNPLASFQGGLNATTDAVTGANVAPVGLGYWLRTSAALDVTAFGDTVENPVSVHLSAADAQGQQNSGWNMLGTPFIYPVTWSAVTVSTQQGVTGSTTYSLQQAIDNGIIGSGIWTWSGSDYQASGIGQSMQPFTAYWIQALRDCTVTVPALGAAGRAVSAAAAAAAPAVPAGGWRVRLAATVAGETDGQNYFGQAPGATDGIDRSDLAKPPAIAQAYVRFLQTDSKATSRAAAFDLHAASGASAKAQTWTVAVTSAKSDADVTLSWFGINAAPRGSRLSIKDTTTGQTISMATRSSYTFHADEAGATRQFVITLQPQASAGALIIRNLTVTYPGRASGGKGSAMNIGFSLNQDADVTAAIRTVGGRLVATVGSTTGRAAAGAQTSLYWDGRSQDGATPPAGPYVLELTARGTDGTVVTQKRPVMILR